MPKYVRMSTEDYRQVNGDAPLSELSDAIKVKYRGRQLASKKLYGVVMSTVDRLIDDLNCYDPEDAAKPRAAPPRPALAVAPREPPAVPARPARRPLAAPLSARRHQQRDERSFAD